MKLWNCCHWRLLQMQCTRTVSVSQSIYNYDTKDVGRYRPFLVPLFPQGCPQGRCAVCSVGDGVVRHLILVKVSVQVLKGGPVIRALLPTRQHDGVHRVRTLIVGVGRVGHAETTLDTLQCLLPCLTCG